MMKLHAGMIELNGLESNYNREDNMLEIGTKAPDFTLPDINENMVSLKDFKGQKIVLWFFPKANTPG